MNIAEIVSEKAVFWFRRNKTEHQISTNALRLLFVGGDFARKGGYTLLEAFRNSLNQDCTLEIVTKDANIERKLPGIENIRIHCGLTPISLVNYHSW